MLTVKKHWQPLPLRKGEGGAGEHQSLMLLATPAESLSLGEAPRLLALQREMSSMTFMSVIT